MEEGGRWTLDRIKEVVQSGGSIEGLVDENTRRNIFYRELEKEVADGEQREGEGKRGGWSSRV